MLRFVFVHQYRYLRPLPYFCETIVKMSTVTQSKTRPVPLREHCKTIFLQGLEAILPDKMIREQVKIQNDRLITSGKSYQLSRNVHVVGFGKAVLAMARQLDIVLGEHIQQGVISVPIGIREHYIKNDKHDLLLPPESKIKMYEGALHNLPDENAYNNAMRIKHIAENLTAKDLLIVLISGGGSALLSAPAPPISVEEFKTVTRLLGNSGATIQELNTVRKNIDELKGGDLARLAYPAKVLSLILSDVINDPLDVIASGPTVKDKSTAEQCLGYFRKFKFGDEIPNSVMEVLKAKSDEEIAKGHEYRSSKDPKESFEHVENLLVGTNSIVLNQCAKTAQDLDYVVYQLSRSLVGEARDVAEMFARLANYICLVHGCKANGRSSDPNLVAAELDLIKHGISKTSVNDIVLCTNQAANLGHSICLIGGGETTVNVKGSGKGGRNQELSLAFAIEVQKFMEDKIKSQYDIEFLSAGTDGQDANTDAAGAFANLGTVDRANAKGLNADQYLTNNDSYTFYEVLQENLKTGLTGTNVMDVCILLVRPKAVPFL